jgi:hypothetical protein
MSTTPNSQPSLFSSDTGTTAPTTDATPAPLPIGPCVRCGAGTVMSHWEDHGTAGTVRRWVCSNAACYTAALGGWVV